MTVRRKGAPRGRFRNLRNPLASSQLGARVPVIRLEDEDRWHPDVVKRKRLYHDPRWKALRRRLMRDELRRCHFCGAWSEVLEHVVGHGADAQAVARILGLPPVPESWEDRFWTGPFVGSCQDCARSRTGAETAGRLLRWTEAWMMRKGLPIPRT